MQYLPIVVIDNHVDNQLVENLSYVLLNSLQRHFQILGYIPVTVAILYVTWRIVQTVTTAGVNFKGAINASYMYNECTLITIIIPNTTSCGEYNFFIHPSVSQSVSQSVNQSVSPIFLVLNSSETAQQNFVKLCSYEGHNI